MPCFTEEDPAEERRRARAYYRHNSDVAEMLCYLLRNEFTERPEKGMKRAVTSLPENIQVWWKEHQERDRKKAEVEKKAKADRIKQANDEFERAQRNLQRALKGR